MAKATYKDSGVNLELYGQAMRALPGLVGRTYTPRMLRNDGGFAGLFQLDFDNCLFARNYEKPVLVACTDGVGTKLKVATAAGRHHTIGIDLVAMCVNDAICCGAEPLFFLDYVAMSRDDPPLLKEIITGIAEGCMASDCALLGGETAIMPDLYQPGEYDLAGFCVGVVERKNLIDGKAIEAGDQVLGLASSGLHSNGYSLVRKVVFEMAKLSVDDSVEGTDRRVGDLLLTPTRIYARAIRRVLNHYTVKRPVHGIAHITGGGLHENLQRILPDGVDVHIRKASWPEPTVFPWLRNLAEIDDDEMFRVFNMGIGLALVVSPYYANHISEMIQKVGIECFLIGEVCKGTGQVTWA